MKNFLAICLFSLLHLCAQPVFSQTRGAVIDPTFLWPQATCAVCWEASADPYPTEKTWVKDAATRTWEANSGFRFTGWGKCDAAFKGVRIKIEDVRPNSCVGTTCLNSGEYMRLNFAMKTNSPIGITPVGSHRQQVIEYIAIHEFGHALGLGHEQDRPDCPSCLSDDSPGTPAMTIGACDTESIMNYCSFNANFAVPNLSQGDINTIRTLYPLPNPGNFNLQSPTGLGEVSSNYDFLFEDYDGDRVPDLIAIKKSGTGTKTTELHILSGASNYESFILQTGTGLHETDGNWDFQMRDCNFDNKLDLVGIKKFNTGSKMVELHILNAATGFKSFMVQMPTGLPQVSSGFEFLYDDYDNNRSNDLICIKKSGTGTKTTEVHILNGATSLKTWLVQTGTALPESSNNFDFDLVDYNRDGKLDLACVKRTGTGTKTTEAHILNGNGFKTWLKQTRTSLPETGTGTDWKLFVNDQNLDNIQELIGIKSANTGSNQTEVHTTNVN